MNRRIRNRTSGGVGGRREQSRLLPDCDRVGRDGRVACCRGARSTGQRRSQGNIMSSQGLAGLEAPDADFTPVTELAAVSMKA